MHGEVRKEKGESEGMEESTKITVVHAELARDQNLKSPSWSTEHSTSTAFGWKSTELTAECPLSVPTHFGVGKKRRR